MSKDNAGAIFSHSLPNCTSIAKQLWREALDARGYVDMG